MYLYAKLHVMAIRINRYLSESGFCSRREADGLVASDMVEVNGEVALYNTKVTVSDVVTIEGERVMPSRAINFNPIQLNNKPRKKVVQEPKVDKLPKWLVELRKKHEELTPEEAKRPEVAREPKEKRAPKPKKRSNTKGHTPKKSFNS